MSLLSNAVAKLEHERDRLADENRRLRSITEGNVILVNRDGFSRPIFIDRAHDYRDRRYSMYQRCDPIMDYREFDARAAEPSCRVKHYRNTHGLDPAGRLIFEEA